MTKPLYHGSKVSGITVFKPVEHKAAHDRAVVFATDDKAYALAMIYGTGDEVAVSYSINSETGDEEMYIDELQKDKLKMFDAEGYLYELDPDYFEESPEELEGEYVSYKEVPILKEEKIENVKEELKKLGAHLIKYDDVPASMESRGKIPNDPDIIEHAPDRFE